MRVAEYAGHWEHEYAGHWEQWRAIADTVAYDVLRTLWRQSSPLAEWLPLKALPKTAAGFNLWLRAEGFFNGAQWSNARDTYREVVEFDPTCLLCSWRLAEVDRQLVRPKDMTQILHVNAHADSFPAHYRQLIRLETLDDVEERFELLEGAISEWPSFYYWRFRMGEELLGRGPLSGRLRRAAVDPLEETVLRRPEFGPAWEHLARVYIAEGETEGARRALDRLSRLPEPRDPLIKGYRLLSKIAFGYRFAGSPGGAEASSALSDPQMLLLPELAAGLRLLMNFDVPGGAVDFGGLVAGVGARPGLENLKFSGLLAQLLGHFALGQVRDARRRAREIRTQFPERDFALFAAQLDALLLMFDSAGANISADSVAGELLKYATEGTGSIRQRRRAAWTRTLLARHAGIDVSDLGSVPAPAAPGPDPLAVLLEADSLARAGDSATALLLADSLRRWEPAKHVPTTVGPFFRTALHLLRAEWYGERNLIAARNELRWHEGWDMVGLPIGAPMVEEVDWAFGTLARWRRSMVLERLGDEGELCEMYDDIVRLWSNGDPVYAARADAAQQKFGELNCEAASG